MRIGVLDVGSNTTHLLIAEGGAGVPLPLHALREGILLRRLEQAAWWDQHTTPLDVPGLRPAVPPDHSGTGADVVPLNQAKSARAR
jgi:hypothetical protein